MSICIGCSSSKPGTDLIVHLENFEQINPLHHTPIDQSWFESENQVVVYFQNLGEFSGFDLDWKPFIQSNQSIKFIFYYSGQAPKKLESLLSELGFPVPIIYDPDKLFYKDNVTDRVTFISYLVKDEFIVGMSNPSMPNFQEKLDELKDM